MKKALLTIYIVALHLIVAMLLFTPQIIEDQRWRLGLALPEPSAFAIEMHRMHKAVDAAAPDDRVILIGDSHFQRMPAELLPKDTFNFGIGGDTVRHMADRVPDYQSLAKAQAIIVWGGYNDLLRRGPEAIETDMERLIRGLPQDKPIYLLGVAPVGKQNPHGIANGVIEMLNERFSKRCRRPCRYVSLSTALSDENGGLDPKYDSGDGIHLNQTGNAAVANIIHSWLDHPDND